MKEMVQMVTRTTTHRLVKVELPDTFEVGSMVKVRVFHGDEKLPDLSAHGAPRELWELEMELSNVSAYAMGPLLTSQEQLAQRVTEIKEKVRGMIRKYGYVGPF